jgi:hypothetical protein
MRLSTGPCNTLIRVNGLPATLLNGLLKAISACLSEFYFLGNFKTQRRIRILIFVNFVVFVNFQLIEIQNIKQNSQKFSEKIFRLKNHRSLISLSENLQKHSRYESSKRHDPLRFVYPGGSLRRYPEIL